MTNYDEYRARRREDPEYRKVERKMKILLFPEEVWFRIRMWLDLRTLALLSIPYILIRGSSYVGRRCVWWAPFVDIGMLLLYVVVARISRVKGWRE